MPRTPVSAGQETTQPAGAGRPLPNTPVATQRPICHAHATVPPPPPGIWERHFFARKTPSNQELGPSFQRAAAAAPIATSGALALVTNCVMAWNTQRLQRAVDRESQRVAPRYSVDALRSIEPVGHRHINLRGTYRFPVEGYADRLVASAA